MFEKAGYSVRSIHADVNMNDRGAMVDEFNTPGSGVDLLILNSSVSSAGLNCHYDCHHGIGFGFVWNVATILQFMGRLFRIGQKKAVRWYLPYIKGTINEWLQERMLRKVSPPPHLDFKVVGVKILYANEFKLCSFFTLLVVEPCGPRRSREFKLVGVKFIYCNQLKVSYGY